MKEEFTGLGARDFRQRYHGSYGFYEVPASKKKILVRMDVVNDREASFVDQKGNAYFANADTGVVFDFLPVRKRLFICGGRLLLQQRQPARMWARGINTQNTRLIDVLRGEHIALNFERLVAAMEPEAYKEEGGIHLLSNVFAIVDTNVYIYDKLIGTWDTNTKCITLESNLFVQELEDLLKKLEKPWKVTYDANNPKSV